MTFLAVRNACPWIRSALDELRGAFWRKAMTVDEAKVASELYNATTRTFYRLSGWRRIITKTIPWSGLV